MRVVPVACLKDNYAYLLIAATGEAAIIDASERAPVENAVRREGVTPRAIWSTHHHLDHVGANQELAAAFDLEVVGHASDAGRLPAITRTVEAGDRIRVAELEARCLHVPGHTRGAVTYFVEAGGERAMFTGDTLFIGGCGRLFEGTAAQMFASLSELAALPKDTLVYCGHEYTVANLRFAGHVEPGNEAVTAARTSAEAKGARGEVTIGTPLAQELATNPFLRVSSEAIRRTLGIATDADEATAFAAIRRAKDAF